MPVPRPVILAILKIVWMADTSEKAFVSKLIDYFEKEIAKKNHRNVRMRLKEPETETYDIYYPKIMARADKRFAHRGSRKSLNSKRVK